MLTDLILAAAADDVYHARVLVGAAERSTLTGHCVQWTPHALRALTSATDHINHTWRLVSAVYIYITSEIVGKMDRGVTGGIIEVSLYTLTSEHSIIQSTSNRIKIAISTCQVLSNRFYSLWGGGLIYMVYYLSRMYRPSTTVRVGFLQTKYPSQSSILPLHYTLPALRIDYQRTAHQTNTHNPGLVAHTRIKEKNEF